MSFIGTSAKKYICPRCNAQAGEQCRTPKGRKTEQSHVERMGLCTKSDIDAASVSFDSDTLELFGEYKECRYGS